MSEAASDIRDHFLSEIKDAARYWAELPGKTPQQRCDGLAFSILVMLDGGHVGLPGMDLVADGTVINECELHGLYANL